MINSCGKNTFCAIGFNSGIKLLFLQLYIFISSKNVHLFKSQLNQKLKINSRFIANGKIKIEDMGIGYIEGIYYKINVDALEFAELYYSQNFKNSRFISFANKTMRTDKFNCFVKKALCYYFFNVLNDLYINKEFFNNNRILLLNTPLNKYILKKFEIENSVKLEMHWVPMFLINWAMPLILMVYIIRQLCLNGFTFSEKLNTKMYRYAIWGSILPITRDDFLIDDITFHKDDILFYTNPDDEASKDAGAQLEKKGYKVIDFNKNKLNIKHGFLSFIFLFICHPLFISLMIFIEKKGYLIEDIIKFYRLIFNHFLFLTNYNVKCHISNSDHEEIAETMLLNKFCCKNLLYHWSDMTVTKAVNHAYTVHNVYYTWGPIHHDFQDEYYYHNKVEVVGCIFLKAYYDALVALKRDDKDNAEKKILICDSSFSNTLHLTEDVYLDYLDLIINMMKELHECKIIFKSKSDYRLIPDRFSTEGKKKKYLEMIDELLKNNRFEYFDYNIQLESLIAVSDIIVNMSMNSPATIALILGKEAVYYDITGNTLHPFTRYKNQFVFDDQRMLIDYVKAVLKKEKSAFDYIDQKLLIQYEPYGDTHALDRLIKSINNEIVTPISN